MKKITLSMAIFCLSTSLLAQQGTNEIFSATATDFGISPALTDIQFEEVPAKENERMYIVPNKLRRNKSDNPNALPHGMDPALQKHYNTHSMRAPLIQWDGMNVNDGQATPPDPSGAVGPNHYFEMVNVKFEIFDRSGNTIMGPNSLGSIWTSLIGSNVNDGDPIVMYDEYVDRWFVSQFRTSNNALLVGVSQTSDPTGSYYLYQFPLGSSFPDYPKYSIWSDGYYITSNKSGDQCYALERDKMIAGDPGAQIVGFTIPQIATPGFFSALPTHAYKTLPPVGTPCYLFYFQDDGWSGVSSDHVKVWEVDVDWTNTANSTISNPVQIPVSPFDSDFTANWDDIEQPGTNAKLDGIPGAFMYPASYMKFSGYSSVVLNHTVDVNGSNHAGIRWYEFRETGGVWSLYQEGTYSPDNQNRWNGSICMDEQGNIGLAYSVAGSSVYASLRYTGRLSSDPLGQLTVAETNVFTGTSAQTNTNRFGDYAHMSLDPTDHKTFWYVGEYISSGWKTGIFSFKLASDFNNDVGVSALVNPTDGILTATENIEVTVTNYGIQDQSNFPVTYVIDGGTPVTETYTGTLTAGTSNNFVFSATADMSTQGPYSIMAYTGLVGDEYNDNDTNVVTVTHLFADDLGVNAITAPASSGSLGIETITVMIENFGTSPQSNFDVAYVVDGGTPVVETVTATVAAGGTYSYDFTATYDFSNVGTYDVVAYTSFNSDQQHTNDTVQTQIEKTFCQPTGNCQWGDGFRLFQLGTINNSTNCSSNGYGDYTNLSTDLERGQSHNLTVQSAWSQQQGSVWIDFNDNFVFEASEQLVTNHNFGTVSSTTTLTIPAGATLGQHMLRARTNFQAGADDPCVNYQFGETEDYTVNIIDASGVGLDENEDQFNLSVTPLDQNNFQLLIEGFNSDVEIQVLNSLGQIVYNSGKINVGSEYKHLINLSNQAQGFYMIKVYNEDIRRIQKIVKE
ncbi:MAG: T9SS type A sorting domain-containing protein [Crocinitomicaceae bacterium]|nr:T9SS type A sorting domain-containing protein [Crocinitomicaceae bacterium]